jgi:hypothetical protein
MNGLLFKRQLQFQARRLGALGLSGLVLMIAAGALWVMLVLDGEREALRLDRVLASNQLQKPSGGLVVQPGPTQEEQIALFYKRFPQSQQVPNVLERIYKAAAAHGVALDTGEYSRTQAGTERLARYRASFLVKGEFRQVLGFMNQALQDNSSVVLEGATFKRDKIDDPKVEAMLVLAILVSAAP